VLVGAEILKSGFDWSGEEVYDHFCYDIQVPLALGYRDLILLQTEMDKCLQGDSIQEDGGGQDERGAKAIHDESTLRAKEGQELSASSMQSADDADSLSPRKPLAARSVGESTAAMWSM